MGNNCGFQVKPKITRFQKKVFGKTISNTKSCPVKTPKRFSVRWYVGIQQWKSGLVFLSSLYYQLWTDTILQ